MPDYQKGLIYKLVALNCENPDEIYYGSTTQGLAKRIGKHRTDFKQWKEGKRDLVTSFSLFETFGIENVKIVLVEMYPCNSKMELEAKEAEYIINNKCINKNIPQRTRKQWENDNRYHREEYRKNWCIINKDEIQRKTNKYYADHKEQKREYYNTKKEQIREKHKEKIVCQCGVTFPYGNKQHHFKSLKHQAFINNEKIIIESNCGCGGKYTHKGKARHLKTKLHLCFLSNQTEPTTL